MKDKFIMVVGVGTSKFLQLFFGLFLSYKYDHGALATFVLIITLSAAMSSIVSLGGAPQIIRAGAFEDPKHHILSTVGTAFILTGAVLMVLFTYIFMGQHIFYINDFTKLDYFFNTSLIVTSLALYSIIQSYLSYKQEYFKLGLSTLIIYSVPFFASTLSSLLGIKSKDAILIYSLFFLISTIFIYIKNINKDIGMGGVSCIVRDLNVLKYNVLTFFKVAMFGFITMLSLYFAVKYVNNSYDEQKAAIYSVSFQFFQIGVFLPSVLGSIFIPKLVKNSNADDVRIMKKIYFLIAMFWVALCGLIIYPIFKLYDFQFEKETILTFVVMQLGVVLCAIQAFYNQKYVALGGFNFLSLNSAIWGGALLIFQNMSPQLIYYSSFALVFAYVLSLFVFLSKDYLVREPK